MGCFLTQNLHPERMKRADRQLTDGDAASLFSRASECFTVEQVSYTLAHFSRRFVGKRDRCDMTRLEAAALDQIRDFLRNDARFTTARAREH
jgi:hypothetical protein